MTPWKLDLAFTLAVILIVIGLLTPNTKTGVPMYADPTLIAGSPISVNLFFCATLLIGLPLLTLLWITTRSRNAQLS
jgi:hypothetical protein